MPYIADSSEPVPSAGMGLPDEARQLAERFVQPLGGRWRHVQAVAQRAADVAPAVPESARGTLIAAAWLHDIGYAPNIGHTRFHPLDGARYLKGKGWPAEVVNLVAHHSGARFEAVERGLSDELAEFPFEDSALLDALVAADLTTGPTGESFSYEERIDEILRRYAPEDPVYRTWIRAAPVLKEAVERTERRLLDAHPR